MFYKLMPIVLIVKAFHVGNIEFVPLSQYSALFLGVTTIFTWHLIFLCGLDAVQLQSIMHSHGIGWKGKVITQFLSIQSRSKKNVM